MLELNDLFLTDAPLISIVGSCHVDLIVHVPRISLPGERIEGTDFTLEVGGGAINSAIAARRLGAKASIVGRIGHDYFGNLIAQYLKQVGIRNAHIVTDEGHPTGLAFSMIELGKKRALVIVPGANSALSPVDIENAVETIKQSSAVIIRLTVPENTVQRALKIAKQCKARIILVTTSAWLTKYDLFKGADFVMMDKIEASKFIAGTISPESVLATGFSVMRQLGCDGIIVTLGSEGAVLVSKECSEYAPAEHVNVKNTMSAGDIFCGAFVRYWASTYDSKKALYLANTVAAISVTRPVGIAKYPSSAEVATFMAEHRKEGESFKQL